VDHHELWRRADSRQARDLGRELRAGGHHTSILLNLRVADVEACYREWSANGATFVTPPIDRGAEIRCYIRDPDGYLIEVGQATGLLRRDMAPVNRQQPSSLTGPIEDEKESP
jgi:catechol 2,3-dioxygenase-like lactoylglutathione lyase family enzyme